MRRPLRPALAALVAFAALSTTTPANAQANAAPAAAAPAFPEPSLPPPSSPSAAATGKAAPALDVHKAPAHRTHHRYARRHHPRGVAVAFDRPALAGVALAAPLPPLVEPPRPIVPMPAYFIDGIASALTIPPPPLVCGDRPRRPDLAHNPRLYREQPVACDYDIY